MTPRPVRAQITDRNTDAGDDTPIMTRGQAEAIGRLKYWTGRPCRRGHWSFRYVSTGMCMRCNREHAREHRVARNQARAARADGLTETRTTRLRVDECAAFDAFVLALDLSRPDPAPFVVPSHIARLPPGAISGAPDPVVLTGDLSAQVAATIAQLTGGHEPPPAPPCDDATPYDLPEGVLLPIRRP